MIDEQKLLHNLKKRNRNSLDDIIKIYTPYVSVIVYNTVGCKLSKEDMEEIVSDTFFLLWQSSLNIDETKGNMRSYLATIARNTSKNKLRKYHSNEVLNVSFSVANGVGIFLPFQLNDDAIIASVKSALGSQSVQCL